jgi:hypothetical protein
MPTEQLIIAEDPMSAAFEQIRNAYTTRRSGQTEFVVQGQALTLQDSRAVREVSWRGGTSNPELAKSVVGMLGRFGTEKKYIEWELRLDHDKKKHFHVNLNITTHGADKGWFGNKTEKYAIGEFVTTKNLDDDTTAQQHEQFYPARERAQRRLTLHNRRVPVRSSLGILVTKIPDLGGLGKLGRKSGKQGNGGREEQGRERREGIMKIKRVRGNLPLGVTDTGLSFRIWIFLVGKGKNRVPQFGILNGF